METNKQAVDFNVSENENAILAYQTKYERKQLSAWLKRPRQPGCLAKKGTVKNRRVTKRKAKSHRS